MYWIIKTEPNTFSFGDLQKAKITIWDGVRNYQARNNLGKMKLGDLAMVYHSVSDKCVVGLAKVIEEAFLDPEAKGDGWLAVKVAYDQTLKNPVSLATMKSDPRLSNLSLIKQSRLSVCPVTEKEWLTILELAKQV